MKLPETSPPQKYAPNLKFNEFTLNLILAVLAFIADVALVVNIVHHW